MIWPSSCPRCKQGALYLDEDDSKHCLHCGYVRHSPIDSMTAVELARYLGLRRVEKELLAVAADVRD